jgi:hypothetical protein
VKALLVRKLLWERVSSEQITALLAGRSVEETKRMFLGGIEMVAKPEGSQGTVASESMYPKTAQTWKRIELAPSVELHIRDYLAKPKAADRKTLRRQFEAALRNAWR